MSLPKCEHFEATMGTNDGFCTKGEVKFQLLKADRIPCPHQCEPVKPVKKAKKSKSE